MCSSSKDEFSNSSHDRRFPEVILGDDASIQSLNEGTRTDYATHSQLGFDKCANLDEDSKLFSSSRLLSTIPQNSSVDVSMLQYLRSLSSIEVVGTSGLFSFQFCECLDFFVFVRTTVNNG